MRKLREPLACVIIGLLAACGGSQSDTPIPPDDSSAAVGDEPALAASCTPCLSDSECGNGVCAQFDGDMFCAAPCGRRCANGTTCQSVQTGHGATTRACIPKAAHCGGGTTGGTSGGTTGATTGGGGGGTTGGSTGTTSGGDGGGSVGPNGGTMAQLHFAVVGDTRPPTLNDTSGYPTAIISRIYSDVAALRPMPLFTVATGDYMFASASGSQGQTQLNLYLAARAKYPGQFFPALGNHECTGATKSNCGATGVDGVTANYSAFLSGLLAPIGKDKPYYKINIAAPDASWTAKFVFVAANAWDTTQESWLDTTLAQPTTYTFLVRHESQGVSAGPPGLRASEAVMARHPYTLAIVGHTHTYKRSGAKEVVFGNGGAPLTGGLNYGFGVVTQRADGAVQVDEIDYQTGQPDMSFRFALKADGTPAP